MKVPMKTMTGFFLKVKVGGRTWSIPQHQVERGFGHHCLVGGQGKLVFATFVNEEEEIFHLLMQLGA